MDKGCLESNKIRCHRKHCRHGSLPLRQGCSTMPQDNKESWKRKHQTQKILKHHRHSINVRSEKDSSSFFSAFIGESPPTEAFAMPVSKRLNGNRHSRVNNGRLSKKKRRRENRCVASSFTMARQTHTNKKIDPSPAEGEKETK